MDISEATGQPPSQVRAENEFLLQERGQNEAKIVTLNAANHQTLAALQAKVATHGTYVERVCHLIW